MPVVAAHHPNGFPDSRGKRLRRRRSLHLPLRHDIIIPSRMALLEEEREVLQSVLYLSQHLEQGCESHPSTASGKQDPRGADTALPLEAT